MISYQLSDDVQSTFSYQIISINYFLSADVLLIIYYLRIFQHWHFLSQNRNGKHSGSITKEWTSLPSSPGSASSAAPNTSAEPRKGSRPRLLNITFLPAKVPTLPLQPAPNSRQLTKAAPASPANHPLPTQTAKPAAAAVLLSLFPSLAAYTPHAPRWQDSIMKSGIYGETARYKYTPPTGCGGLAGNRNRPLFFSVWNHR